MGTVADRAAGPLAPPTPPPEPPQQQKPAPQPEPPPPEPRAPEPQAQPKAEPPPQQTAALTAEPPPPSAPQEQAKAASPDKPAMLPDPAVEQLLKIPTQAALPHTLDPPKPPEPAKPATPAKPEQARRAQPKQSQVRTSSLDLSLPPSFYAAPFGGGGVGVHRPAGVTRSGENDTFSRGVIAALQRSMPQLRETLGRVTVRIILDKDGSLVKTEVIRAIQRRRSRPERGVLDAAGEFPLSAAQRKFRRPDIPRDVHLSLAGRVAVTQQRWQGSGQRA